MPRDADEKTVAILTLGVFNHVVVNTNPTRGLRRWCSGSLAPYKDCPVTGTFTKVTCTCMVDIWVSFADHSKENTYGAPTEAEQKEDTAFNSRLASPHSGPSDGDICVSALGHT